MKTTHVCCGLVGAALIAGAAGAQENAGTLSRGDVAVNIGNDGGVEIAIGRDVCRISSRFSRPAQRIGWNTLGDGQASAEANWRPALKQAGEAGMTLTARGSHYSLERTVSLGADRLTVEDTLTNNGSGPVGIMVEHNITGNGPLEGVLLGGGAISSVNMIAENPTVFFSQSASSIGILAQDNVFRLQYEAAASPTEVKFGLKRLALKPGESYTLRWTVYLFERRANYFDLVNKIRRDWNANYTVQGPFDWISVTGNVRLSGEPDAAQPRPGNPLFSDPAKLKAYLKRKKIAIVGLLPFHAYWTGAPLSNAEYKERMRRAIRLFKEADPEIKCVASTENNIVSYDRAKLKNGGLFDNVCRESGEYPLVLSEEQTRILEAEAPWGDSLVKNKDGRAMIEDCAPKTFIHMMVYSAPGNYHTRYLLEQARFLFDEVGLDGIYMDHFNMAWDTTQRYDYSKWDGRTVDISPETGEIVRRYTDAGLVGIGPRKELCEYIFSKGKLFVVNTQNVANETQSMPVLHFEEVGSNANPNALKPGQEPPLIGYVAKLQLGSPIGLGIPSTNKLHRDIQDAGEVMRTVLVYLRHGLLYYHNQTTIPESGPGNGEYGPINHMFPMTPVELGPGFVVGKERIITAISLERLWAKTTRPQVLVFDLAGRPVDAAGRFEISSEKDQWRVKVQLKDWAEIAVVE